MMVNVRVVKPPSRLGVRARWDGDGRIASYELRLPDGSVLVAKADALDAQFSRARTRAKTEYFDYQKNVAA